MVVTSSMVAERAAMLKTRRSQLGRCATRSGSVEESKEESERQELRQNGLIPPPGCGNGVREESSSRAAQLVLVRTAPDTGDTRRRLLVWSSPASLGTGIWRILPYPYQEMR